MKVLLWGPLSEKGKPSKGGYEATNRKISDRLAEEGIEVLETPFFSNNSNKAIVKSVEYFLLFLRPINLIKYIRKKDYILQITPPGGYLMYPAAVIVRFAKLFGIPTVVHIMAGTFFILYDKKGIIYRKFINLLIKNASAVAVEGKPYIKQIRERIGYNGEILYLPTMVNCRNLKPHVLCDSGKFNLFYFGRLNQAKGVNRMLEIVNILDDRFHLYLDGFISNDINKGNLNSEKTTYLGVESKDELLETMKRMTFFIFPTTHIGEGQANSLIEAMSEGLIPITSNQGFCSDVVGDCGIVLSTTATAQDYKEALLILCEKDLEKLSEKCQERIKNNHNIDVEIPKLIRLYRKLTQQN